MRLKEIEKMNLLFTWQSNSRRTQTVGFNSLDKGAGKYAE